MINSIYKKYGKRFFDISISLLILILSSPLLLLVSAISYFHFDKSIIFKQLRPGKGEVLFSIYKLKTMRDSKDSKGNLLSDEARLTWWGKFLRSSSIDELPQLINVIIGDMSLIGPRPLLIEYLPYYSIEQRKRHDLLPGITGLAQVRGRNSLSWQEKFELDVAYVNSYSLSLDLQILFETIKVVLSSKGVSQEGHATFERFTGNPEGYIFTQRIC